MDKVRVKVKSQTCCEEINVEVRVSGGEHYLLIIYSKGSIYDFHVCVADVCVDVHMCMCVLYVSLCVFLQLLSATWLTRPCSTCMRAEQAASYPSSANLTIFLPRLFPPQCQQCYLSICACVGVIGSGCVCLVSFIF